MDLQPPDGTDHSGNLELIGTDPDQDASDQDQEQDIERIRDSILTYDTLTTEERDLR